MLNSVKQMCLIGSFELLLLHDLLTLKFTEPVLSLSNKRKIWSRNLDFVFTCFSHVYICFHVNFPFFPKKLEDLVSDSWLLVPILCIQNTFCSNLRSVSNLMAVFIGISYISRMLFRSKTPVGHTALNPLNTIMSGLSEISNLDINSPKPLSYLFFVISSIFLEVLHIFVRQCELSFFLGSLESFPSWQYFCFET